MFGVEGGKGCVGRRGELWGVISSSRYVVMRVKWVGRQFAFPGCKVSSGITRALYSYCTCVVGSTLEGGLGQRSGLVRMA